MIYFHLCGTMIKDSVISLVILLVASAVVDAHRTGPDPHSLVIHPSLVKGGHVLHVLPLRAELERLNKTLAEMTHADEPRLHHLMHQATLEAHAALQLATQPLELHLSHAVAKRRLQQATNNGLAGGASASNSNPEWVTAWESQIKNVQDTFANFQVRLREADRRQELVLSFSQY